MTTSLIIHGGAGRIDDSEKYRASLLSILAEGRTLLSKGTSAVDTVEACVRLLENNPLFNAGHGSVLNAEGKVEMDASIVDGMTLKTGAIASVRGVKNPVTLARMVMDHSPHVLLATEGAERFGKEHNTEFADESYFITPARVTQLANAQLESRIGLDHDGEKKLGTVGAVAFDTNGNIAAATSTGGLVNKKFGRVGDTPIIGAGVFADNAICGVSCTGIGEDILRVSLAKHIANLVSMRELGAVEAAKDGIEYLKAKVNGQAGVIVIDSSGALGVAHSTPAILAVGYEKDGVAQCFFEV